eukprot:3362634-Pleurochrysis_carterae.AAC.2
MSTKEKCARTLRNRTGMQNRRARAPKLACMLAPVSEQMRTRMTASSDEIKSYGTGCSLATLAVLPARASRCTCKPEWAGS